MTYMKRFKRLCGCQVNIYHNNNAEQKLSCKFHKLMLDIQSSYLDYKSSGDKSCYWIKMWFKYQIRGYHD